MYDFKPLPGYPLLVSNPISSMKWKIKEDHVLTSPLGIDDCRVEVVDTDEYVALKPGEDERIRQVQARLFCEWVIDTRGTILGHQIHYLLGLFDLSQSVLADALQLTGSAVSQLVRGKNTPSPQTARQIALLFLLEGASPGTIRRLAEGKISSATAAAWAEEFKPRPAVTPALETSSLPAASAPHKRRIKSRE